MQKILCFLGLYFCLLFFSKLQAQNVVPVNVSQYDSRIEVQLSYDHATQLNRPNVFGSDELKYVKQYVYITIRNKTQNHVTVKLTYFANKICGIQSNADVNDANGWGNLRAGETKSTKFDITYGSLGDGACLPVKQDDGSYSYIGSVGWELTSIKEDKPEAKAPAAQTTTPTYNSANTTPAARQTAPTTPSSNYGANEIKQVPSSPNSSSKTSTTTGSTAMQRQAALEAEQLKKYNEQRQRNAETQKQNQELGNQLVQGTTELAGVLGNMFAQNRKDREKREAKKEAARLEVAQEAQAKKQEWDELFNSSAQRNLEAFAAGDESAAIGLAYDKLILDKPDESEKWYGYAAERGDVRGMIGMADVTKYRIEKLIKSGVKRNDKKQIEDMKSLMLLWQEKSVMAGSIEACSTLVAFYRADPKMTSFALLKGDERIISILKRGSEVGYITPLRHLGILFTQDGKRLYEAYCTKRKMADTTGAASLLHQAVDNYSPDALVEILKIYTTEHLQNADTVKVLQILSKAAMLGNLEAIDNLVYCYTSGFGVRKNPEKVAYWNNQKVLYQKYGTDLFAASHQLQTKGQNEYLYSNTNYKKSLEFHLEAAALGNAKSMESISYYYKMPGMTEEGPDLEKSAAWKEKAKLALREKPYDIE